jgi:hypothetical protein
VFVLNEKYLKFLGNVNDNAIYFLNKDRETLQILIANDTIELSEEGIKLKS